MTSQEGETNNSRRKFLGALGAGGLMALGVRPEEAEAVSIREGVSGYFLFGGFDKTEDEKKRYKDIENVKNQNTTIELEKKLLKNLNDKDIEEINTGVVPSAAGMHSRHYRNAMVLSGAMVTAGAASGLAFGHMKKHIGRQEYEDENFFKTISGTLIGALIAGGIVLSQQKIENVKAAEKSLLDWMIQTRQAGYISKESITERVQKLTELQKANSAEISKK